MSEKKVPLPAEIRVAIDAAQAKQAADVTLLNLEGLSAFTGYFLLCTGFSTPQVNAICDHIEDQVGRAGVRLEHREGREGAEWMLLDFGGFIVHVFTERARQFYDIERLWRAARRTDFSEPRGTPSIPIRKRDSTVEAEG